MGDDEHELDAPAPPGGPQRTDEPAGTQTPGEAKPDPDPDRTRGHEDNEIPEPQGTEPEQSETAREAQEENAETSLDQPST